MMRGMTATAGIRIIRSGLLAMLAAAPSFARAADPVPAAAAPAPAPAIVSLADRATDDGMQRLFDAIATLQVDCDGTQSVAALLAFSPAAERQFRQAVLAARQIGSPRQARPGVTAVDASISIDALEQCLTNAIQSQKIDTAPKCQPKLARAAGPIVSATGQAADDGAPRDARPGWRHCSNSDVNMSLKAAEADLRQRVRGVLGGLQLSNRQPVSLVLREHPELDRSLRTVVERLTGGEAEYDATGLCVLSCSLSAEQMAAMVNRALADAKLNTQEEFKAVAPAIPSVTLQGFCTAPPRKAPTGSRAPQGPRPEWADRILRRTAEAAAPATDDPQERKTLAVKAATIEARRQLWLDIEKLALPGGRTVETSIAGRSDAAQVVQAIDAAIFVMSAPVMTDQGTAKITLGIRLEAVWQIVER
jgi:hypothetical protein